MPFTARMWPRRRQCSDALPRLQIPEEVIINGQAIKRLRIESREGSYTQGSPPRPLAWWDQPDAGSAEMMEESPWTAMDTEPPPPLPASAPAGHGRGYPYPPMAAGGCHHHLPQPPPSADPNPEPPFSPRSGRFLSVPAPTAPSTAPVGDAGSHGRGMASPCPGCAAEEVDAGDVNYSIINTMLKVLHLERIHRCEARA
jgi:hypothetical protein